MKNNIWNEAPECCNKKVELYSSISIPRVVSYSYWECSICGKKIKDEVEEYQDE